MRLNESSSVSVSAHMTCSRTRSSGPPELVLDQVQQHRGRAKLPPLLAALFNVTTNKGLHDRLSARVLERSSLPELFTRAASGERAR